MACVEMRMNGFSPPFILSRAHITYCYVMLADAGSRRRKERRKMVDKEWLHITFMLSRRASRWVKVTTWKSAGEANEQLGQDHKMVYLERQVSR